MFLILFRILIDFLVVFIISISVSCFVVILTDFSYLFDFDGYFFFLLF